MTESIRGRFIAFDVETPNAHSDRISAIGVTVVEEGALQKSYYTLVDPQTHFDRFNVALTGITPAMVAGKPSFPALWRRLEPLLSSGILTAHNAPFDLSVLARCLRDYGISWRETVPYVCTCQMSRRLLPQVPDHKLETLSRCLGLDLTHHHAGSDSRACGAILLHCLQAAGTVRPFLRTYDLTAIRTLRPSAGGERTPDLL